MSGIEDRLIDTPDGGLRLLGKRPVGGIETVMQDGRIMRRVKDADAAFADTSRRDRLATPSHSVVTRSEAAKLLGVEIEEAAKVLDVHDVGKVLEYDRLHVEAIAKALREHKPTVERTITVDPELSS